MTQANNRANPSRPLGRVLDRLDGVKPQNGYFMARCPAHDDREPSLSVKEGDDGRVLLNCFTGCSVENIVAALDLSIEDLFERRNGYRKGGGSYPSEDGETVKPGGCTRAAYAAAKKLPEKFLESVAVGEIANYNGHPAVRFSYVGTEGEEVCVRFRVSLDGDPKIKTRRGDKLTLYGLSQLNEARKVGYVVVVEGESDAQTL